MNWNEELYMIQQELDKGQYDQYDKARWSGVSSVVKLVLILGCVLFIGFCASTV